MNTEKLASIIAALDAKKLPSQKQVDEYLSFTQRLFEKAEKGAGDLSEQANTGDIGRLSKHGSILARDTIDILEAYKVLGDEKNHDDLMQEAIWNLSQADINVDANLNTEGVKGTGSTQEVKSDAQRLSSAIRTLGNVLIGRFSDTSSPLFAELLSFLRLSLANAAENVEEAARSAKENLRSTENEVQAGDRDALGRNKVEQNTEQPAEDPSTKFERRMDSVKHAGSKAIGTGQQVKETTLQYTDTTKREVLDAFDNIIRRAQADPEYNEALTSIFDILGKWVTRPLDIAGSALDEAKEIPKDTVVEDPNGRLTEALHQLNVLLERAAGGRSTEKLYQAFRVVRDDIRRSSEIQQLASNANAFLQRGLQDSTFADSEEFDSQKEELMQRWRAILNAETPESQKFKTDVQGLNTELEALQDALRNDVALNRLRLAIEKFSKDMASAAVEGTVITQTSLPWIWKDLLNVYLPLVLDYVKGIPIPRMEFKDSDIEFVVEDLSIESLRLLPGHAHISTTVNMDMDKAIGTAEAETDTSTRTHLKLTGVQMALREVSFWYHDPSLKLVSEVRGLMDVSVPPRGVDVQATLKLIPTASGKTRREQRRGFHEISDIQVTLASDTKVSLKQTNHQVLMSAFSPIVKKRLIKNIENILAEKIRLVLEAMDGIAWDVDQRANVFSDTGLTATVPKYLAAMVSEWGKLRKEPGLLSGWTMTGVGVVKDDPRTDTVFAVGAAPQIIPGDKHGPHTNTTSTTNSRVDTAQGAKPDVKGMAMDAAAKGVGKVKTFKESVDGKIVEEKQRDGWRSPAFDLE